MLEVALIQLKYERCPRGCFLSIFKPIFQVLHTDTFRNFYLSDKKKPTLRILPLRKVVVSWICCGRREGMLLALKFSVN